MFLATIADGQTAASWDESKGMQTLTKVADEQNRWKQGKWTSTTWLDTFAGTSVDAFVGRFVGAFVGALEGLKTGKSTLAGAVVGALVGDLVGALVGTLVGPLVVPLVVPLVGRGSLSPALFAKTWPPTE